MGGCWQRFEFAIAPEYVRCVTTEPSWVAEFKHPVPADDVFPVKGPISSQ